MSNFNGNTVQPSRAGQISKNGGTIGNKYVAASTAQNAAQKGGMVAGKYMSAEQAQKAGFRKK